MLTLRGTQQEFVDKGVEILTSKSTRKTVMVAPVAYGKSICIANIVARLDAPCIVLQPNKELLEQNYAKYTSYGYEASIYSASLGRKELGTITYGTIGSMKSKIEEIRKLKVKYLIIDECHMATGTSSGIAKFIKALRIKNVLGVTATPVLLSSGGEGTMLKMMDRSRTNLFSTIGHVVQIQELVAAGYWAKLKYDQRVTSVPHLEFNKSGSEYTVGSMYKSYIESETEGRVIKAVKDMRAEGRKSILVFVPTIKAAEDLQRRIKGSAVVHGKTKKKERAEIVRQFKEQELDVLINVEVFTTGFDNPGLDCIIMARPTASITLYYQILGRGTRIHPDKENCKIVDLSGNVATFGGIERLNYHYIDGYGWGLYTDDLCLTHAPIKSIYGRPTKEELEATVTISGHRSLKEHREAEVWFGKFKGMQLQHVPAYYLNYLLEMDAYTLKMKELQLSATEVLKS